ncbi:MAG: DUF5723 family protein [Flavobacteriales bacterium]|nr:DUF5723 family protein [Flavobacteriales bacterium]MDG1779882.1 DUF5723 family protein [Flavobacteriales bacterium]MDG2245872.1 DUF5723 family protein [Flavobacteriales bacterium]
MKQLFLVGLSLTMFMITNAQTEGGAFSATGRGASTPFVTDYHAIGINPANLNLTPEFEGKTVTFGLFEGGASFYSEFLTKEELRKTLFRSEFETLNQQERIEFGQNFAGTNNNIQLDIITSGFAINGNWGGLAFSTKERIDFSAQAGDRMSELLFLGNTSSYFNELVLTTGDTIPNTGNLSADTLALVDEGIIDPEEALQFSEILDGTSIGFSWIREFNLAYGKKLISNENYELHAGVGAKLLIGNAYSEINSQDGNLEAFSALSPVFDINYDEIQGENPSALEEDASNLQPVGLGFGVDLGATFVYKQKLFLSASVIDIGSMTWDGNVYTINDQLLIDYGQEGAESADLIVELLNFNSPENALEWEGAQKRTTKLPTTARLGAGFKVNDKLRLAADAVLPVNDQVVNYDEPIVALGADFRPLPFIQLSGGMVNGGNQATKIPVGITFFVGNGSWECGLASRDMITWFTDNNPTSSLSFGFLRFRV